jgi:hypothetical protein
MHYVRGVVEECCLVNLCGRIVDQCLVNIRLIDSGGIIDQSRLILHKIMCALKHSTGGSA